MICPKCREEYDDILVRVCPTCDVDLVDRLPGPEPDPGIELLPVLTTSDAAAIAFVESLLQANGIEYYIRSERVQDLFGYGRFPAGFNAVAGPSQFVVRTEDADRARELLRDVLPSQS